MHAESEDEYVPSVLRRPKVANHTLHETFTADTRDHEDHTFCGVMFDVQCKGPEEGGVPVECLVITCLAVRGDLGPLTVWTTPDSYRKKEHEAHEWDCIYEAEHPPSNENYQALELRSEIRLQPGESCGLYVHSKLPGDDALVYVPHCFHGTARRRSCRYDNQRSHVSHEDDVFKVLPGQAHLSNRPFGRHGMWGFPWRDRREFVGRISYGVNYRLWNPVLDVHLRFPRSFRQAVWTILLCARKPESPLYWLHDEVLFYILNMCKYDWFSESRTRGRGSQFKLRAPALRGQAKGYQGGPAVQQVNLSLDVESTESESSHSGPTSNTSSW
ncbi:unnamed protein product [Effrenium voratum]|uniref:Uncharacterized protein n=1 Tax=Effrenium voratum TaxID=2562239 RepID=A0AA36NLY9_9DINO|nr:unnamed protein product [Effrenium voratum]CAJ1410181.1 unnamed protein product [Effrenium voratum]CAJ1452950.1 unnamed protein product [Effrenium voratum]